MLQFTRKKVFTISAVVVVLVALYALAGFVLAPRILRSTLLKEIPKTLGVMPTVGEIRFNPFRFQLEIKDFSLAAPNGERLLGFRRLFVGFELSSIWYRAYTFANIEIDAPSVNAMVARDGHLNLLQMKPKASQPVAQGIDPLGFFGVGGRGLATELTTCNAGEGAAAGLAAGTGAIDGAGGAGAAITGEGGVAGSGFATGAAEMPGGVAWVVAAGRRGAAVAAQAATCAGSAGEVKTELFAAFTLAILGRWKT